MSRSATSDPLVGRLLEGRYRVGERIARGGMATVYEGTDIRLDREVAIKVMPHALSEDEDFAQRFVREARASARLSHPNVVAVYDQGDDDATLFLVMEYVPGQTLRDLIRNEAPLAPERALRVMDDILLALTDAHDAHIVHRDIKPENVLISPEGRVKVADFGLARAISSTSTATATSGVLMGTVSYMAPELVTEGRSDARTDVYAAGVVLYELLTGTKPYEGEAPVQVAYKHVHQDMPVPSASVPGISPYLDALVARATARDPNTRPTDARVLLRMLRRVQHAIENGVVDDAELTEDLSVGAPPVAAQNVGDEQTMVVGLSDLPAAPTRQTPAAGPDFREHTPVAFAPASDPPAVARMRAREQRRGRRGLVALLVVLLLAAVAAVAGWYYGVGRYTDAPNVVGMSETAARAKVEDAGLSFRIASTAYSEDVADGAVISTDPGPGDRVLTDGTVRAVVSRGPERHSVPRVVGQRLAAAERAIDASHLNRGPVTSQWSDTVAKGVVISAHPGPSTSQKPGTPVTLVVSSGPEPITVQDFIGTNATDARSALREAGFVVRVRERHSETVRAGHVIRQLPDTGTAFKGDRVVLVVSLGPTLVKVPDVMHFGVEAAKNALAAAGFVPNVQKNNVDFGLGFVVGQNPGADTYAPKGSVVTIIIV